MEVLVVISIIVILCAIAIPSMLNIQKSLKLQEKDNYAKTIYLAAQNNLLQMRSNNQLSLLDGLPDVVPDKDGYAYVSSPSADTEMFDLVLPLNSVESTLRDQQIIIEFNPSTGSVLSVFYADSSSKLDDTLESTYISDETLRTEDTRKDLLVGYYYGNDLKTSELKIFDIEAQLHYDNGEAGILYVDVPLQTTAGVNIFENQYNHFMAGLEVTLSLQSDTGVMTQLIKQQGDTDTCTVEPGEGGVMMVRMAYPLDSLRQNESFAALSYNYGKTENLIADPTKIVDESGFAILPGENITAVAEVSFTPASNDPIVDVRSAVLGGINPMFDALTLNDEGKYILSISNGRHLQNLNLLSPAIAQNVEEIVFVADAKEIEAANAEIVIDWKDTLTYYNGAVTGFTPINHGVLFTEYAITDGESSSTVYPSTIIKGNNCKIYNLNIDTSARAKATPYYSAQPDSNLTGLFGYINTKVENLYLVNPTVKGGNSDDSITAAFAGVAGSKAQFVDCGMYLDTEAEGFNKDNHYVSGTGVVGGMVGYSLSDVELGDFDLSKAVAQPEEEKTDESETATVTTEASEEDVIEEEELLEYVSFYNCYAAVPVHSEDANTAAGGFVGVTQNSNFYACYASGDVLINVPSETKTYTGASGGFVGSNNGSCYSNCFATGKINVNADAVAVGGFVGLMNYEGTIENQHTVFSSCYSVGTVTIGEDTKSNFSGFANVAPALGLYSENYYDLLAPQFIQNGSSATGDDPVLNYQSPYIYKDCYYLDQSMSGTVDSCASAIGYKDLMQLHELDAVTKLDLHKQKKLVDVNITSEMISHLVDSETTEQERLTILLDGITNSDTNNLLVVGSTEKLFNYWQITNIEDFAGKTLSIKYDIYWADNAQDSNLNSTYTSAYENAFLTDLWCNFEKDPEYNTYPYEFYTYKAQYPFTMLKGMDYYGDWPTLTPAVGLAYYEKYEDDSYGFYFDKEETSTLDNTQTVIEDGYALLTVDKPINLEIDGKSYAITEENSGNAIVGRAYQYILLDESAMKAADDKDFYTEMEVELTYTDVEGKDVSVEYSYYYNPLVAISQVNPTDGSTAAPKPSNAPDEIYIRTARQFYNIGVNMDKHWFRNYVQQRDIDFSTYVGAEDEGLSPITAFSGTYDGGNHKIIVTADNIVNDKGDSALFGMLTTKAESGNTLVGTVKNLTIVPVPTPIEEQVDNKPIKVQKYPVKIETDSVSNFALAVAHNESGIIDNVDVEFNGDVIITPAEGESAPSNLGFIVGQNSGSMQNCEVRANDVMTTDKEEPQSYKDITISITATRAGGIAGLAEGCKIENCSVSSGKYSDLILHFDNSMNAGGLVAATTTVESNGKTTPAEIKDCAVNAHMEVSQDAASVVVGGLVAYSHESRFSGSNSAAGSISVDKVDNNTMCIVGGAVGYAVSGSYQDITSSMAIDSKWAGYAANSMETDEYQGEDGTALVGLKNINPSTFGSVGKFVGHVDDGIFDDCSAIAADKTNYQFFGTIKATEIQGPQAQYYSYEDLGDAPIVSDTISGKLSVMDSSVPAPSVYTFGNIVLEKCTFDLANGGEYSQRIGGIYYYNEGAASVSAELDVQFTQVNADTISSENTEWDISDYFYLESNEESGNIYHRLYSRVVTDDKNESIVQLAMKEEAADDSHSGTDAPVDDETQTEQTPNGDDVPTDEKADGEVEEPDNVTEDGYIVLSAEDMKDLYTLTIPDGDYVLLTVDEKLPLANGSYESSTDFNTYAKNPNCVWTINGNEASNNGTKYPLHVHVQDNNLVESEKLWVVPDGGSSTPHSLYTISKGYLKVGSVQTCMVYLGELPVENLPLTVTDSNE